MGMEYAETRGDCEVHRHVSTGTKKWLVDAISVANALESHKGTLTLLKRWPGWKRKTGRMGYICCPFVIDSSCLVHLRL